MRQTRDPRPNLRLHRFALLTAAATFCLLIAGGLVTSTDSGLSVPDWPLSYGTLFPPMVGGIAYEHSHRLIAGVVALLIAALALWLHRRESRPWARALGYAAAGGVLLQAILGGLTVLWLLPMPVSVAHACLGQTVFCVVAGVALVTSRAWQAHEAAQDHASLRRRCVMLLLAVVVQLALGAVFRHSGRALGWHMAGAVGVVVALVLVQWRVWRAPRRGPMLSRLSVGLAVLVVVQIALGVLAIATGRHPLVTTAHVAIGALIYASTWLMVLWTSRSAPSGWGRWIVREPVYAAA